MAINPTVDKVKANIAKTDTSPLAIARAIVQPISSLKLTVFLLAVSVLVVWIATLDQTRIDIWELKNKHFSSFLVYVPFQTLLPPAWFPTMQDVPGGFYIPSGITLIFAMLINLTAAHSLRFRIQARGIRLVAGLLAALFCGIITWNVAFSASEGVQSTSVSYASLWTWLQIAMLGLSLAAIAAFFLMSKERKVERFVALFAGIVGLCVLGFVLLMGERVGDSAMRILWQLIQATVTALTGLLACLLLFRRKAGIVLLHFGIAGLLLNEIYVTVTNEEQQMEIVEGATVSEAVDIRSSEMVVFDRSDAEYDNIVAIPSARLRTEKIISHEDLPFDVECLDFYLNSDLVDLQPGQKPRSSGGLGQSMEAIELPQVAGADADKKADFPAAYVRLLRKDDKSPIGIYMISVIPYRSNFVDTVTVDGKDYQVGLRFKHVYKPYSIKLNDVSSENYLGTEIPRTYASDIVLTDFERETSAAQNIWMNNPLRYGGETFYQQGYDNNGATETTVLQIVKNHGWMIPYLCCMFVVVGLVHQFGSSLLSFTEKRQRARPAVATAQVSWIPAIVLLVIFGAYFGGQFAKAMTDKDSKGEMRLELLGQIPVTHGGRVQPLDSVARNLARQLGNRETVVQTEVTLKLTQWLFENQHGEAIQFAKDCSQESFEKFTKEQLLQIRVAADKAVADEDLDAQTLDQLLRKDKQSAMRWLADTVFESKGFAEDYQFLRIEDLNVLQALSLPHRSRLKYSWSELQNSEEELIRLLREASALKPEQRTPLQTRLNEVYGKMSRVVDMKRALTDPAEYAPSNNLLERLGSAAMAMDLESVPLAVATENPEEPWMSIPAAISREWLNELATEFNERDVQKLAAAIVDQVMIQPIRKNLFREELGKSLVDDDEDLEQLKKFLNEESAGNILKALADDEVFDTIPKEIYADNLEAVRQDLEPKIERGRQVFKSDVARMMTKINGKSNTDIVPTQAIGLSHLKEIWPAYAAGDADRFNGSLEAYFKEVNANAPVGMSSFGVAVESIYNRFSPFYLAMVVYLVAFVISCFSWMIWREPLNRAAYSLVVLGLLIHFGGIVARVMISGRPPVTNLYSSFLFVSATGILFILIAEKITKLGVGTIMASLLGFLVLMWAWAMSISDGDTFTVLQAVLDTQFWLSTHVICISLGYCATIAAGFLGIAYIFGAMVTKVFDKDTRRLFANVMYGVICFGLLFSFFGTVLGGLWADDSWGRFWGWDPKENGALMIVLWNAVVLHARWAGLIRERGLAALAVIGNIVTVWSWEAVNQMGVGLHAYGGSEGNRMAYVAIFWLINLGIVGLALVPTTLWSSYRQNDLANEKTA